MKLKQIAMAAAVLLSATQIAPPAEAAGSAAENGIDPGAPPQSEWHSSVDWAMWMPCSHFRTNSDGSWTMPGPENINGALLSNITFGAGSHEGRILQQRCSGKKP